MRCPASLFPPALRAVHVPRVRFATEWVCLHIYRCLFPLPQSAIGDAKKKKAVSFLHRKTRVGGKQLWEGYLSLAEKACEGRGLTKKTKAFFPPRCASLAKSPPLLQIAGLSFSSVLPAKERKKLKGAPFSRASKQLEQARYLPRPVENTVLYTLRTMGGARGTFTGCEPLAATTPHCRCRLLFVVVLFASLSPFFVEASAVYSLVVTDDDVGAVEERGTAWKTLTLTCTAKHSAHRCTGPPLRLYVYALDTTATPHAWVPFLEDEVQHLGANADLSVRARRPSLSSQDAEVGVYWVAAPRTLHTDAGGMVASGMLKSVWGPASAAPGHLTLCTPVGSGGGWTNASCVPLMRSTSGSPEPPRSTDVVYVLDVTGHLGLVTAQDTDGTWPPAQVASVYTSQVAPGSRRITVLAVAQNSLTETRLRELAGEARCLLWETIRRGMDAQRDSTGIEPSYAVQLQHIQTMGIDCARYANALDSSFSCAGPEGGVTAGFDELYERATAFVENAIANPPPEHVPPSGEWFVVVPCAATEVRVLATGGDVNGTAPVALPSTLYVRRVCRPVDTSHGTWRVHAGAQVATVTDAPQDRGKRMVAYALALGGAPPGERAEDDGIVRVGLRTNTRVFGAIIPTGEGVTDDGDDMNAWLNPRQTDTACQVARGQWQCGGAPSHADLVLDVHSFLPFVSTVASCRSENDDATAVGAVQEEAEGENADEQDGLPLFFSAVGLAATPGSVRDLSPKGWLLVKPSPVAGASPPQGCMSGAALTPVGEGHITVAVLAPLAASCSQRAGTGDDDSPPCHPDMEHVWADLSPSLDVATRWLLAGRNASLEVSIVYRNGSQGPPARVALQPVACGLNATCPSWPLLRGEAGVHSIVLRADATVEFFGLVLRRGRACEERGACGSAWIDARASAQPPPDLVAMDPYATQMRPAHGGFLLHAPSSGVRTSTSNGAIAVVDNADAVDATQPYAMFGFLTDPGSTLESDMMVVGPGATLMLAAVVAVGLSSCIVVFILRKVRKRKKKRLVTTWQLDDFISGTTAASATLLTGPEKFTDEEDEVHAGQVEAYNRSTRLEEAFRRPDLAEGEEEENAGASGFVQQNLQVPPNTRHTTSKQVGGVGTFVLGDSSDNDSDMEDERFR